MSQSTSFNRNVFINCPIDEQYDPIFHAIVFAITMMGFRPRCSRETTDSGTSRLEKIMAIIADCKYGIHDISRTQMDKNNLPRFNMPLELGIDFGFRYSGNPKYRKKNLAILDTKEYRYQKFLSDLAGRDPFAHQNSAKKAVLIIRTWLGSESGVRLPSGRVIYDAYKQFRRRLPTICKRSHLDMAEITFKDYNFVVSEWLNGLKKKKP